MRLTFLLAPMAVKQQYRNEAHALQPHNLNVWLKLERHEMHSRMQCRILSLPPLCTCVMRRVVPLHLLGCQTASLGLNLSLIESKLSRFIPKFQNGRETVGAATTTALGMQMPPPSLRRAQIHIGLRQGRSASDLPQRIFPSLKPRTRAWSRTLPCSPLTRSGRFLQILLLNKCFLERARRENKSSWPALPKSF